MFKNRTRLLFVDTSNRYNECLRHCACFDANNQTGSFYSRAKISHVGIFEVPGDEHSADKFITFANKNWPNRVPAKTINKKRGSQGGRGFIHVYWVHEGAMLNPENFLKENA